VPLWAQSWRYGAGGRSRVPSVRPLWGATDGWGIASGQPHVLTSNGRSQQLGVVGGTGSSPAQRGTCSILLVLQAGSMPGRREAGALGRVEGVGERSARVIGVEMGFFAKASPIGGSVFGAHGTVFGAHGPVSAAHGPVFGAHGTVYGAHGMVFPAQGIVFFAHGTVFSAHGTVL
jgi:hypothetical protein